LKHSIVIPTCGDYHLLDRCLRGIFDNTDVANLQIIVVCNGSDRESAQLAIQNDLQLIWYKDAIGYTKATNAGLKLVTNPITILMNTDTHLLNHWPKNKWLEILTERFDDDSIGITGLSAMNSEWGKFIPFYLAAIRTDLFDKFGYLDERFNPGYGEDLDFTIRIKQGGYKIVEIDPGEQDHENQIVVSSFPIYHRGQQSFSEDQRKWCLQNAHDVLNEKWGKELSL